MSCPQNYLTDMQEVILFYKGLKVPTRQILDSKSAIPTMTAANVKAAIQKMAEHSQKWHDGTSTRTNSTKTSDGLAAIQAQLNNINQGVSIKALKIQIGQMSKVLQEKGYGNLPRSTEENPRDHVKSILTTVETDTTSICCIDPTEQTVKHPKGIAENVLVGIGKFVFLVDFIILDMPEDVKVPLILERTFLST
ncbi:hypothetical protein Tco_1128502, partial [Tanacetum coccineum]